MTLILVLGQMDSHIIVIQLTATFVSRALDVWRGRVSPLRCTVSIQVICKVYPWTNHGHVLLSQTNKRAINGLYVLQGLLRTCFSQLAWVFLFKLRFVYKRPSY